MNTNPITNSTFRTLVFKINLQIVPPLFSVGRSDASLFSACLLVFVPRQFIETGLKLMKRFGEEHATAQTLLFMSTC